jgi:hypothetical protein
LIFLLLVAEATHIVSIGEDTTRIMASLATNICVAKFSLADFAEILLRTIGRFARFLDHSIFLERDAIGAVCLNKRRLPIFAFG